MDWMKSLNMGIEYIENNLLLDININDISKAVNISNSHFQRAFSIMTGFTINEYIRNRRLTLAGEELLKTDIKIIDLSMKYNYETPESFTKAFTRFHNVSPSKARKGKTNLKSFNPLIIKIILEGGNVMDYRIEKDREIELILKLKTIENKEGKNEITEFWDEYFSNGLDDIVTGLYGVCGESFEDGSFKYGIGNLKSEVEIIPDGFEVLKLPATNWVVFKSIGKIPESIQNLWEKIYSEWLPQTKYEILPGYEFEKYTYGDSSSSDYISEVWIPIK